VIAIFTERMLRGEVPSINGNGTQTRDYVYVADVVAANLAAIAGPPGAYNVGTGTECDVNELHRRLARIIGVSTPPTTDRASPESSSAPAWTRRWPHPASAGAHAGRWTQASRRRSPTSAPAGPATCSGR